VKLSILARLLSLLGGLAIAFSQAIAFAQITPDQTLGSERSVITPNVNVKGATADQIDGGAMRGSNLFHSFSEFNIQDGQRVYFANPAGITNILGRVTGNNPSDISGILGVNGNANLFFINPNGIIFGQNARLDVAGSFVASTANAIKFGDGREFRAIAPQTAPLLTVNVPIGLQFGGNGGSIQVQGDGQGQRLTSELIDPTAALRVAPNQTLALVGGNLTLEGATLKTAGGRIELGSVADSGLVSLTPIESGFALGYADIPTFGDIRLSGGAVVDASGAGGGDIQVQGRQVTLEDGSQIEASTLEAGAGGILTVRASEAVKLMGQTTDGQFSSTLGTLVYPDATGTGGNITVQTGELILQDGAQILAATFGEGDGGDITLKTSQLIVQNSSQIVVNTYSEGDGGNLSVEAGQLILQNRSAIVANTFSEGNSGNLSVKTGQLIVQNRAVIGASTFSGGDGGNLTVSATDSIELIGTTADVPLLTGLSTSVQPMAIGKGGNLTVETGRLIIRDGAQILANTLGEGDAGNLTVTAKSVEAIGTTANGLLPSGLFTSVEEGVTGKGGNLTVETGQLILRDGAQVLTGTFGQGDAGSLTVLADELVELAGTSADGLFFSALGTSVGEGAIGKGGNLRVETGRLILRDGAQIQAATFGEGDAGSLTVLARESVQVLGSSSIGTSVGEGAIGKGGNLRVETGRLILRDGAQITAGTLGKGEAGSLTVLARSVELDNQAAIITTATSGNGGNITLELDDLLLLRRNSRISATAGIAQQNGNGGNISINAPKGFIVAPPNENSDITANAFNGSGGKVTINATGIFGLKPLSRQELERSLQTTDPTKLDPSQLPTSDITAISQTNPSLNGEVNLNTLDTDPSQGLQELPTDIVDVSGLINQNLCVAAQGSEFIVTGKGGLPSSPYEIISQNTAWEDWLISPQPETKLTPTTNNSSDKQQTESTTIIEAQGLVTDANGNLILTAKPVTVTAKGTWLHPQDCHTILDL
jgi:filamentous hemagglutinin family protein